MKKFLTVVICLLLMLCAEILSADNTVRIDLMLQDIYVTKGFSPEWINSIPADSSWKKIPKSENGKTRLSIPELKINGLPEKRLFSLQHHEPELVTVIIPFQFKHAEGQNSIYALFFPYIGGCWEMFLNGRTIKNEMHLDVNGRIDFITNSRNIFIPVQPDLLKTGDNILAIKIYGDPVFVKTGIYQNRPNILADIKTSYDLHTETLSLVLISVYLFIGIYHIFVFMLRRSEKLYLYFGLLCIFLFFNQFARTTSVYNFIADSIVINRIELVFLFGLLPLLGFFIESVLFGKVKKFTYIYSSFFALFAIMAVFAPMSFVYDFVQLWEKFIAVPLLGYILLTVIMDFKKNISEFNPRFPSEKTGILAKSLKGLVFTNSGRLLLSLIVIALCVILDIFLKRYYYVHINPARFGFFILIIGTTLNLADNFIYIHRSIESLNISLNQKIADLNIAYEKISVSEERYRMLIEGTDCYICTTDLNGGLLTANNAFMQDLKFDADAIGKVNIIDIFYDPIDYNRVTRKFIQEKLSETIAEKKPVLFRAKMKTYFQLEPREMSVQFEIVNIEGAHEILVRIYDTIEDSLLKNMICEKQVMEMGNFLGVAEEISHRLVRNVQRYYDPKKTHLLRIALREMILNSIEHGNLDISYESKSEAIENDQYFEFIAERQNDPRYRDKKVTIEYSLTPRKVTYIIRDEGEGFDHNNLRDNALLKANELMLAHGRGIAMTLNAFDQVEYNDRGNEVKLVKYFDTRQS